MTNEANTDSLDIARHHSLGLLHAATLSSADCGILALVIVVSTAKVLPWRWKRRLTIGTLYISRSLSVDVLSHFLFRVMRRRHSSNNEYFSDFRDSFLPLESSDSSEEDAYTRAFTKNDQLIPFYTNANERCDPTYESDAMNILHMQSQQEVNLHHSQLKLPKWDNFDTHVPNEEEPLTFEAQKGQLSNWLLQEEVDKPIFNKNSRRLSMPAMPLMSALTATPDISPSFLSSSTYPSVRGPSSLQQKLFSNSALPHSIVTADSLQQNMVTNTSFDEPHMVPAIEYAGVFRLNDGTFTAEFKGFEIAHHCTTKTQAAHLFDAHVRKYSLPSEVALVCNFCSYCGQFLNPLRLASFSNSCTCFPSVHNQVERTLTQRNITHAFGKPMPPAPSTLTSGTAQATLENDFLPIYWRNGRRNVQCFPKCPEFEDFYHVKTNKLVHECSGICKGIVYTTVYLHDKVSQCVVLDSFIKVSQDGHPLGEHNPNEFLGKSFTISQLEAWQNTYTATRIESTMLDNGIRRERYQVDPKLWRFEEGLKKKRKPTKSSSGRVSCYALMSIVLESNVDGTYTVLTTDHSSPFEMRSTRTIERAMARRSRPSGQ